MAIHPQLLKLAPGLRYWRPLARGHIVPLWDAAQGREQWQVHYEIRSRGGGLLVYTGCQRLAVTRDVV